MYRISFSGDRKPETVPDEIGKNLYQDWQSGEMPERVEIRNGLTIERRYIREIEHVPDFNPNRFMMTNDELRRWAEQELKPFLDELGNLTPHKELEYLVAKGLITVVMHKAHYMTASDATLYVRSDRTADFERVTNVLSQWKTYQGKLQYAQKKELEELDRISSESTV